MSQENLFTPSKEYIDEMNQKTEASVEQSYDNAKEAWREHALRCVEAVAKRQKEFTINEVRDLIHAGKYKTHDNRAVGGVMKTAQSLGIIEPTGKTIPSIVGHRVHIQIWRSLITDKEGNYTIPPPPKKKEKAVIIKKPRYEYKFDPARNVMVQVPITE